MTAHRLWPDGAAFLHSLCILARGWCAGAHTSDHRRLFATIRAQGERISSWDEEMDVDAAGGMRLSLPGRLDTYGIAIPSAHAQLQARALLDDLEKGLRRFVVDGSRLPGVHAHGLCPGLSVNLVGGNSGPQGAFVLHDAGLLPDPTWRDVRETALFYQFGRDRSIEEAAEAFLDDVDTLVRHAPQPGDPSWVFVHPAGQYKERLDWIGGPVEASNETAALAVARVVLKFAKDKEGLMAFQRPTVEGILPVRRFRFADIDG